MPDQDGGSIARFAATFSERFATVMDEARGAMAGISASAGGNGLIPPEALARLHEIYRLRIELEMETAGVLWRTAEVACALADAIDVLNRRVRPAPLPPAEWLVGLATQVVELRGARPSIQDEAGRGPTRWPDLGAAASDLPAAPDLREAA